MNIKIAICDDEIKVLNEEVKLLEEICNEKQLICEIDKYTSSVELSKQNVNYDLVVLDIEMDGINGIDLAKVIKQKNDNCFIIFITNYPIYLDDAFDVNAIRYLTKPVDKNRLSMGVDSVIERIEASEKKLTLTKLGSKQKIDIEISSIMYIATSRRHTSVLSSKYGEFEVEEIFSDVKSKIEKEVNYFCQSHQSFFVNLKYVVGYDKNSVSVAYAGRRYEALMTRRRYKEFDEKFFKMAGNLR